MCTFSLKPRQRELLTYVGGVTRDDVWRAHDGIVPTCSMRVPWGYGNSVVGMGEVLRVGRVPMGVWVDLGLQRDMDHADCIGTGTNSLNIAEAVGLYMRLGKMLAVLEEF